MKKTQSPFRQIKRRISSALKENNNFLRHCLTLLSGNVFSQLISFGMIPILARLYTPESFGNLALFMSIISILKLMATGKYDYAINMANSPLMSKSLLRLSNISALLFSLALLLLIVPSKALFPQFSYFYKLGNLIYLVPFMVFLSSFCLSCTYYANRKKRYPIIMKADMTTALTSALTKLGAGMVGLIKNGQILSVVLAQLLTSLYYYFKTGNKVLLHSKTDVRQARIQYKDFPLYVMPRELLHDTTLKLPFLLLAFYFRSNLIGYLALAMTLSFTPSGIIATALTKVLYQQIGEDVRKKRSIKPLTFKLLKQILYFFVPLFILLFFLAKPLFHTFFSEKWENSVSYFQILLPWLLFYLLASPLDFIPNLFKKQKAAILWDILYFILSSTGLLVGIFLNNFTLSILLFSISGVAMFCFLLFWYLRLITQYEATLDK